MVLKLNLLLRITIGSFVLIVGAIDPAKAQNSPQTTPSPTPTTTSVDRSDIIFFGDTENFDSTVLVTPLFNRTNFLPSPSITPDSLGESLPNYPIPAPTPPGTQLTPVLVCRHQPPPKTPVRPEPPSPCFKLATLAGLPSSGIQSGQCEMKLVPINISALRQFTIQSNDKEIKGTSIDISLAFDSATQNLLGIKSSQSKSWQYLRPSPNVGNICQIPWPPDWRFRPPPPPCTSLTPCTPPPCTDSISCERAPEPITIFGMGIGICGLGVAYKKKKKILDKARYKNDI
ncbi:MAG: PEP-CTERM sorting domain-containing protein [Richelia sp. CSU_2_1]|nr:PEP-CTERM sorting domain-containing protein [Microcoleus sp. SU_5_6]NJL66571.1 PEP-CTERM sorting domain-containing protein [Microcoleus sp. SM1_3_4]NJR22859.1 PEP-CTERM sorting domain-containing protein [Richelia sp. CSU_2_1]